MSSPLTRFNRINVVGSSGSGKSRFSAELASALGYPHVELDRLHWRANWQALVDQEFFPLIAKVTAQSTWVLDGNYSRTERLKWARVEAVVWLDYSFARTLFQSLKRALYRSLWRQEVWPGTGNVESIRRTFFSRDSVLLLMIQNYHRIQRRYAAKIADPEYDHITFFRLRNPKQAKAFIASIKAQELSSTWP